MKATRITLTKDARITLAEEARNTAANEAKRPTTELLGDEEREFAEQERLAADLIAALCGLEQATRFYDINNDQVRQVLTEMAAVANRFTALTGQGMDLTLADYSVFVNRRLVRLDFSQYRKAQQLMETWSKFGIGEIIFEAEATADGLIPLARSLMTATRDRSMIPYLFVKSLGCVRLAGAPREDKAGKRQDSFEYALRAYCGLHVLVRQMLSDLQEGKRPPLVRIKRALQVLVDSMRKYRGLYLALACQNELNRELAAHLVNTALLSLLLGQRLGFDRRELMGLATAALFHDLPKLGLNDKTLNRLEDPRPLADKDKQRIEQHWLTILQRMVEAGGLSDELLARLVVIFESQLEFERDDLYPELTSGAPGRTAEPSGEKTGGVSIPDVANKSPGLCLLSQIISVCSRYNSYCLTREGKPESNPHAAMLNLMEAAASAGGNPALPLLLLEALGLYPTGSLVLLNTGEIGVIKEQGDLDNSENPLVRIVVDAEGNTVDGPDADLSSDPTRSITWPMSARHAEVNPLVVFGTGAGK